MGVETELFGLKNRWDGKEFRVIERADGSIAVLAGEKVLVDSGVTPVTAVPSGSGVVFQIGDAPVRMGVESFSLPYPLILVPSGTFGDTAGNFTLGTALPAVPNGTVPGGGNAMIYLPAGAGGLAAGWYAATFSSTTAGQLVGAPVTTATAWTQTTSQITALTINIGAGSLGPNGCLDVETATSNNNSAGVKTIRWGVNASTGAYVFQNTTALSTRGRVRVRNRGAQNKNVMTNNAGQYSGVSSACQTTAIDFSVASNVQIALQLNTATDYNILELADLTITYGA